MANFPTNPLTGQLFETKNETYKWNGDAWELLGRILTNRSPPSDPLSSLTIKDSGGRLDVPDTDTVLLVGENIDRGLVTQAFGVDTDTTLLIGETFVSGLPANTVDFTTKLLINSSIDSSNYHHKVVPDEPKSVRGYSFDGSADYLTLPDSTDWDFGTGDWTIELWMYPTVQGVESLFEFGAYNAGGIMALFQNTADNDIKFYFDSGGSGGEIAVDGTTAGISLNAWTHVALVHDSGNVTAYINGTSQGTLSATPDISSTTRTFRIGTAVHNASYDYTGYIDDFRISKGIARYTSNFTTEITTKDSYHKLILDGLATDSSDSSHTVTFNDDVQQLSKFGNTSWEFNGVADYIAIPYSTYFVWPGEFTVEMWVKFNDLSNWIILANSAQSGSNYFRIGWKATNNTWAISTFTSNAYYADTLSTNTWYHIAMVRDSNDDVKFYRDGVLKGTDTTGTSGTLNNTGGLTIGANSHLGWGGQPHDGHIEQLRISKGVARYTPNFTPHTAPHVPDIPTKLLVSGNSSDGSNRHALTFEGDAEIIPAGYSFDGTGDHLSIPSSSDFAFGANDFTIETWIRYNSANSFPYLFDGRIGAVDGLFPSSYLRSDDSYKPTYYTNAGERIRSSVGMSINTWYHFAIARTGGTTTMYLNGAAVGSFSDSNVYAACPLRLGDYSNGGYGFNGHMNKFRISKGIARYTANFTTEITTKDSYHKLILDGKETDSSSSAHTLTFVGDTITTAKRGPYSMFFDGTGDYVHIPPHADFDLGTGDFTLECWANWSATNSSMEIMNIGHWTTGQEWVWSNSNYFKVYLVNATVINGVSNGAFTPVIGQWYHLAVTRSGTDVKLFVDGTQLGSTGTSAGNIVSSGGTTTTGLKIGNASDETVPFNGYFNDVRITKGIARYTSNFYIEDGYIPLDKSSNSHVITTVGDAAVSTTEKKFITYSLYFDGTGDYLDVVGSSDFNFGTNDFTIEFWIKPASLSGWWCPIASKYYFTSGYDGNWAIDFSGGVLRFQSYMGNTGGATALMLSSTISLTTNWQHVAFIRSSGTMSAYIDGVAAGSNTDFASRTLNDAGNGIYVGAPSAATNAADFNGYLDDFRISKGVARYTGAFNIDDVATLADKSANAHVLTAVGNAGMSTVQKKFGDYSLYFDGTGDRFSIPDNSDFDFGSEDFAIEFWMNASSVSNAIVASQGTRWQFYFGSGGDAGKMAMYCSSDGSNYNIISDTDFFGTGFTTNTWYHIAFTREGNLWRGFRDGVLMTTVSSASTLGTSSGGAKDVFLGDHFNGNYPYTGYIDDFRITKGLARYGTNFTPPTKAFDLIDVPSYGSPSLPANTQSLFVNRDGFVQKSSSSILTKMDSGTNAVSTETRKVGEQEDSPADATTKLLLHMDGDFTDSSGHNHTVTATGSVVSTTPAQFGTGSGFFDGSNDYLEVPYSDGFNFGTGDFTVEMWYYPLASLSDSYIITVNAPTTDNGTYAQALLEGSNASAGTGAGKMRVAAGVFNSGHTNSGWTNYSSTDLDLNTWHHIAVTRSGSTVTCWVNGIANSTTGTASGDLGNHNRPVLIGRRYGNPTPAWAHCNLDEIRISKGIAKYTSNFTPATAPFTVLKPTVYAKGIADADLKLLLHVDTDFTDSSSSDHTVTAVGGAAISTAQFQLGTASAYFDGAGDYLSIPDSSDWDFGADDFTIEFWVRPTIVGTDWRTLFFMSAGNESLLIGYTDTDTLGFSIDYNNNYNGSYYHSTDPSVTGEVATINTWYHVAFVRDGTDLRVYLNGILKNTNPIGATSLNAPSGNMTIGGPANAGSSGWTSSFAGYMDEFRISKGVARYTANFTPKTVPFKSISGSELYYIDPKGIETKIA